MKLGVASITIVIFALWLALGALIFGLLDSAGALSQLFFIFVWLGVLRVAFAIYDPRGERSASVMKAHATLGKALAGIITVVVLTFVVIATQLVLPDRLLYRVVVLAIGGLLLMSILIYFEPSTDQQK